MPYINWKSINKLHLKDLHPKLISFFKDGNLPSGVSNTVITRFKKRAKMFEYDVKENKIYLIADNSPPELLDLPLNLPLRLELINPTEENITAIVSEFFNNVLLGAFRGVEPLYKKIKTQYLGITREDVSSVVKRFQLKQIKRQAEIRELIPLVSKKPLDIVQVDLLDVSEHQHWNDKVHYLLNVVDHFSKFAWSIPLKNKSGSVVATKLLNLFLVEGFPDVLQSDNGGEFKNNQVNDLAIRFGFTLKSSLPYHSQAQGLVEKFNSTCRNLIHNYQTDRATKRYIEELPSLIYSYNTTEHSVTKFTPFNVLRKKNEIFKIDGVVAKRIKQNALAMSKKHIRGQVRELEPLEVGDLVRISTESTTRVRSYTEIEKVKKRKNRYLSNFTKEVYTITGITEEKFDDGVTRVLYKTTYVDSGIRPNRSFFRAELQKVADDEIEMSGRDRITLDRAMRFNEDGYDKEAQLIGLSKAVVKEAVMSEEQLKQKVENEEKESQKRPKRSIKLPKKYDNFLLD